MSRSIYQSKSSALILGNLLYYIIFFVFLELYATMQYNLNMQVVVMIKPNSKHREEVIENNDGSLTVYTKAAAIEGRANEALVRLLAEYYKVPKSRVAIVRGATSRLKTIRIDS